MALSPNTTLAAIASAYPALARELERRGLDYCCGGQRSLDEACRQQGLNAEVVAAELSALPLAAEPPEEWQHLDPAELVDHIETTHHRYLKKELPRLSELADKVSQAHGQRHPELIRVAKVLTEIRSDLEPHLRKEEEVFFPMARTLAPATALSSFACGSIANSVTVMEAEHTAVGGLLEQLRQLTGNYTAPADTCASTSSLMAGLAELESDLHAHVHKENNHLFPALIAIEERLCG
jgi:regulator of cell morphogenesis and NO signaling